MRVWVMGSRSHGGAWAWMEGSSAPHICPWFGVELSVPASLCMANPTACTQGHSYIYGVCRACQRVLWPGVQTLNSRPPDCDPTDPVKA